MVLKKIVLPKGLVKALKNSFQKWLQKIAGKFLTEQ